MHHHILGQQAGGLPSLSCQFCHYFAETAGGLRAHQRWQHSQEMFHCQASPACRETFLSVTELRLHLTGSHLLPAFDCGKLAKAGRILLPRDLRLARCSLCRAELFTAQARASHDCGAALSWECRACERYQLASGEKLETHINLKHGSWVVKTVQAG